MVSFPYYSHIFRDSYGIGMGIVWEAYHKGVPLLEVPGITLDQTVEQLHGLSITTWSGAHRWPYVFLDFGYFVPRFTMFLCFFSPQPLRRPFSCHWNSLKTSSTRCRISAGLFPRNTWVTSQVWTCVRYVPKQSIA